jgi:transcriptional regulator with XRE-family HTH domain
MSEETDRRSQLARRLRVARDHSGLSQDAVARHLNLQRPAISEIEAGRRKVSADELATFSDLYHTSMEWLVSGDSDEPSKLELAARGIAKLKPDELDTILNLLKSLRDPKTK